MKKRLISLVSGRVQLVMYRDFAARSAKKLGLTGTVQNQSDGRVRVVAEGEEAKLREFLERLYQGPLLAHVTHIDSAWLEPTGEYADFSILYS